MRGDLYGQGGLTACRADGCPTTVATIDVYMDGSKVHTSEATLEEAGELWEAFTIDWADRAIVPVDVVGWTEIDDCQE